MSKVLVTYQDGDDGIWKSDRLRAVSQEGVEGKAAALAYTMLLGFGGESGELGRFELNAARMAATVAYAFPGVKEAEVAAWTALYAKHGLLIPYTGERDGRTVNLGAWIKYRRTGRFPETPKWPAPPGCREIREEGNILLNVPLKDASISDTLAPMPAPPKPRRATRSVEPAPEVREVIDFYVAVWEPKVRVPYTAHNATAIERSLGKGYEAKSMKAAIFAARYGPHQWYREANHDLEYLTRPGVIEQILQRNQAMNLSSPAVATAAVKHQVHALLVEMGFRAEAGGGTEPGRDLTGEADRREARRAANAVQAGEEVHG